METVFKNYLEYKLQPGGTPSVPVIGLLKNYLFDHMTRTRKICYFTWKFVVTCPAVVFQEDGRSKSH